MNRTQRLLLLIMMITIALVIGIFIIRQNALRPHVERIPPTATPTLQNTPDLSITVGAEVSVLSQAVGNALQETANASVGSPSTPTATLLPSQTPCAFTWAHQDLPDVAPAARKAFAEAGQTAIGVIRAEAFGESCGSSFGAMTTDFYLSAAVNNVNDVDELAQVIVRAYQILSALDVPLPAAPGYLDIQFASDSSTKTYRAMFSQIKAALDARKDSQSLVELGNLR